MLELSEYQNKGLVWYGCNSREQIKRIPSGFNEVDQALQGGFPEQGIIELKTAFGVGELRLMTPFLSAKQNAGQLVFVAPPIQLNAEYLMANHINVDKVLLLTPTSEEQSLWATEQCLSSGCCSAVVLWQDSLSIKQIRRLMLACEQGGASLILFRYQKAQPLFSLPSTVSLSITSHAKGIQLKVDKQKGGRATDYFTVDMSEWWPELISRDKPVMANDNVVAFPRAAGH
ncbi:translesion DNA synthesis-associated protein ImuA [Psychrosphaera ytuae]|uniref:Translesion DNA synthesis-associated protein ImuA n=1 Tax=Psychrosphaera ytuae TaxID=2820710 RepID=A0A975D9J7_9GAMM|nr:translesion DNA synthesis-associated protein ImuA [Psychrosphaera ytuae]QTH62853.1 translesion DNA synthesis-associated protein ImuA [Psychrosphaera ytuae]